MDAAQNASLLQQLTNDAEYWHQILQRADLSSKERQQIEKQFADEEIQINRAVSEEADRLARQDAQIAQEHAKTDIDLLKMREEAQLASITSVQAKTIQAAQEKLATEEKLTRIWRRLPSAASSLSSRASIRAPSNTRSMPTRSARSRASWIWTWPSCAPPRHRNSSRSRRI